MRNNSGRRGGVLAVVLVSILVVAGLILATIVATGIWVARRVHVEERTEAGRKTVQIETPAGVVRVGEAQADPKRIGIPVYPGASLCSDCGKSADVELNFGNNEDHAFSVVAARYTTADPPEQVMEFYRNEIPTSTVKILKSMARHRYSIHYDEHGQKRFVNICERNGRTEIALVSLGEPRVN